MAREKLCPKCGEDITDTHMDDDPECGISAGWVCEACNEGYPDEPEDDTDNIDWDAMAEKRLDQS